MPLSKQKQDSLIPLFGAVCFFLSVIEFMIPKPLPFLRLGLANLPLLFAADLLSFSGYLLLVFIKIIGQAVINGTLFSYILLFSMAGSISSALVMFGLRKISGKYLSFIGISVAGSFSSNMVQVLLARFLIFGEGVWYILPPFFIIGAITGVALGSFVNSFVENSSWYQQITDENYTFMIKTAEKEDTVSLTQIYIRIAVGFLFILLLVFVNLPAAKAIVFGAALILCLIDRQKIHFISLFLISVSIIVFNLLPPFGKVLFSIFDFPVTAGALLRGIEKVLILEGMIYTSRWMLNCPIKLPGAIGKKVSDSLIIFKKLVLVKSEFRFKDIIGSLDEILFSVELL
ncbi:Gx transporter family protein [Treponema phagedenis]|uniref:Gx transporter family protein n=1 Tax=Treponema phagedenis TaxID=162 RepID=UPI0001F63CC7|nr:Gx transporter family protein [Treponema phagedenis]EFW37653.1 heptaprenyl diphosphate synthase component I [Treponema phagedenis F0421]TYT79580.1 heptaprenyl diphosphate synthase [Treponema phagedenis]